MAQQEEGWPLGLQPLNVRVVQPRNGDFAGSISFNTLLTGSPTSSTDSSSDLDTESAGSFFHDKSITLGSLIGVSSILDLSREPASVRKVELLKEKKTHKSRTWIFSLCSKETTDAQNVNNINNAPSLGHFLAVARRAANECGRKNQSHTVYGPDELDLAMPATETEPNSLFVNGHVAPWYGADDERARNNEGLEHGSGYGAPVLFTCMCGQPS